MNRRSLLLGAFSPLAAAETPRNKVARLGNEFHTQWSKWAEAFNSAQPGTVSAEAAMLYEPMPKQFREFERAMRSYFQGQGA